MPPIASVWLRSLTRPRTRTFRRHRLCLIPGEKPSDCQTKLQIASVPTTVVVGLKQGHFMSGTTCIDIILFLKWACIPQLKFFILLATCDFRLATCFCYCFNQMMHEYIDARNYPYK
jgi:hypothetical protein